MIVWITDGIARSVVVGSIGVGKVGFSDRIGCVHEGVDCPLERKRAFVWCASPTYRGWVKARGGDRIALRGDSIC